MKYFSCVSLVASVCALASCAAGVPEGEYLIEGKLGNVPDGTVIELFRSDGQILSRVASDTVSGGRFEFRDTVSCAPSKFGIASFSEGFPALILPVWVGSGEKVTVTGEDRLLLTWNVKSRIPEQRIEMDFIAAGFPEKKEALSYEAEEAGILHGLRALQGEERRAAWAKVDSLRRLYDPLDSAALHNVLEYMRTAPVSGRWLEELANQAHALNGGYGAVDSDLIHELYSRLSPADLETELGQVITACLNPPEVVGVGDRMADGDLYDAKGDVHHLSDLSGKYILLDFWSVACGPCMESIPEGNEVARRYSDKLAFVRLSLDTKETWLEALGSKNSDCLEWNELKAWGTGLSGSYQVDGIPRFVLISPDGRILDTWTGYGKGSLLSKVKRHLGR